MIDVAARLPSLIGDDLLRALATAAAGAPPGAFVEVGVYKGGSAQVLYDIARHQGRELFLYDTFAGMPVSGPLDSHPIGDFADCSVEKIRAAFPSAHVIQGIFPHSIVPMPPIAFVHADADQYESTLAICEHLYPQLVTGGAILFDDYRGLRGCIEAVDQCFPNRVLLECRRALVVKGLNDV